MKIHCFIQGTAVAVLLVLFAGCKEEDKHQLRFSHYLHVEDMEMACSDCHGDLGEFQVISHATCIDCHDEPEAKQMTPETCGMCHIQDKLYKLKLVDTNAVEKTAARAVFVHTEALESRCAECHGELMNEELETVPMLNRRDIVAIRETAHGSGQDCLTCHVDMARNQMPANHDVAWMKRHGQLGIQDEASCNVCHSEDSCKECHSVMQPVNHNNIWRMKSHGAVAAWNRASCQVCHEEDSCASCHAENRPRSHNGRWAAPGAKPSHCIGCHNTSTPGDGCVTCHEGGNDVMLHEQYWGGASIDHNQPGIENCYICHWIQTP